MYVSSLSALALIAFFVYFQPQHSIPDVMLWMVCEKKRIAYYRLPAKDLIHATQADHIGKHCGKMQTIFLRVRKNEGIVLSFKYGPPYLYSVYYTMY